MNYVMKKNTKNYKPTFFNGDLSFHLSRVTAHFDNNPEHYGDAEYMPQRDYIEDNGEGEETFVIDLPCIEESYLYSNKTERDNDFSNLTQILDLWYQLKTA